MTTASPTATQRPVQLAGVLTTLGGLYATQGLVSGLAHEGLPVLLRAQGIGLDKIGLLSLLFLPTTIKFLWAARTDRITGSGPSTRLLWAGRLQLSLLAGMLALILLPPQDALVAIFTLLLLMMLVTVTQDIVTDGMAVQTLSRDQRGLGNTMQIGGSYLGYILGGGLWVMVVNQFGWIAGMGYMASLLLLCAIPALWLRKRALPSPPAAALADTRHPSVRTAWRRPTVRWGMATVVAFQASVRWFTAIMLTYLIDHGFDVMQVGLLSSSGVALAGIAGAFLGGRLLNRVGRGTMLKASLVCYLLLQLAYLIVETQGWYAKPLLIGVFLAFCLSMSMGFVVLYTLMMDWSSPAQAGTDYSVFQCTDALCAVVFGLSAGVVTHHVGYGVTFAITSVLALAGLILAPRFYRHAQAHA